MERRVKPTNPFVPFKKSEIEQSIPSRFIQQVRGFPDRTAVKTKNYTVTYKELNIRANSIAQKLVAKEKHNEEPISVLMDHDGPMIEAILGILMSGNFFVPLDSVSPLERTRYMLKDCRANVILTDDSNLSTAQALANGQLSVINVEDIPTSSSYDSLDVEISPDSLAYIIYTSGSTGEPKGVVQTHRNVLHNVLRNTNATCLSSEDRLSLLSRISFSASTYDVFGTLMNGAALFPFDLHREGFHSLGQWLMKEQITTYHSVPSVYRYFCGSLHGSEEFSRLRLIRLGGETVLKKDIDLYRQHFANHSLLCISFGTTETSAVRLFFMDRETPMTGAIVPVGYEVDDVEVSVVDENLRDVEFNQIGEICVRSPFLARGYWNKPVQTETSFIPDRDKDGFRMYVTGDLGSMSSDGCLLLLGRKDLQVKIHGHRIEVAEVEAALLDIPQIRAAVVVVQKDQQENQFLVAYIVAKQNSSVVIADLRTVLTNKLPGYMVPSAFVMLENLPMSPTGKLDRLALPVYQPSRVGLEVEFKPAQTSLEKVLTAIWIEILGLKSIVGIHDDFFNLGGHSLSATQVISRVRDIFQIEVALDRFFNAPTVKDLAEEIIKVACPSGEVERIAERMLSVKSLRQDPLS